MFKAGDQVGKNRAEVCGGTGNEIARQGPEDATRRNTLMAVPKPSNDSSSPLYPAPREASVEERGEVLAKYRALSGVLRAEIEGLTPAQLAARPVPGTWSMGEIVLHLADSEQVFADRFKRIVAEERPRLMSFDENRWMEHLAIPQRDVRRAATLLELVRLDLADVLGSMPDETLLRTGEHDQIGPISLLAHVKRGNWHVEHHLKFLREKKDLVIRNG